MRCGVAILVCSLAGAAAGDKGPRREGFTGTFAGMGGGFNYTDECEGCGLGPSVGLEFRAGWMFGREARLAAVIELVGMESWHEGVGRVHGVLTGGLALWIDRVSLSLTVGAGITDVETVPGTSNEAWVNGGVAVVAGLGVDLVRWEKVALVVRAMVVTGDYLEGAAVSPVISVGVDVFGIIGGR